MTDREIYAYLYSTIGNPYGVCALMGNMKAESNMNPTNLQNSANKKLGMTDAVYTAAVDNGIYTNFATDNKGYGLCQWTSSGRKQGLLEHANLYNTSIGDAHTQCSFLLKELSISYKSVMKVLKNAASIREASDVVVKKFERPANQSEGVLVARAKYGEQYLLEVINMNAVDKLISISVAEEGYLEKATNAQLDDKTANAGKKNFTKYGKAMGCNGSAWCDAFADWCFVKAFGWDDAEEMLNGFSNYTPTSSNHYKVFGHWTKVPKVGFQIFFKNSTRICHTGIVYKVDKTYVYTVEGNTSSEAGVVANGGCVRLKKYKISYSKIAGYGIPAYELVEKGYNPFDVPTTSLKRYKIGMKKENIMWLQYELNKRGYLLDIDGSFGAKTDKTLKLVQASLGLTADGSCGPATREALLKG